MTDVIHKKSLTVIIPAYNEASSIAVVLSELDEVLVGLSPLRCHILVIDDGSSDQTANAVLATDLKTPIKVIRLSRNFGKEIAMSAGLEQASDSDAVVIMDADGQHPPELITEFVSYWLQGYEDVYAVRDSRNTDGWLKRQLSSIFYRCLPNDSQCITKNAGDFRLLSSRVVNALNQIQEKNRFMKGLYGWVGFKKKAISYQARPRISGETKFSLRQLLKFAMVGLTSFSVTPLRIISRIGMAVSLCSLLYGVFIFFRTVLFGVDLPGWSTLVVGMAALSGVQLISIGILGEYIGQVFIESKNRPLYLIDEILIPPSKHE